MQCTVTLQALHARSRICNVVVSRVHLPGPVLLFETDVRLCRRHMQIVCVYHDIMIVAYTGSVILPNSVCTIDCFPSFCGGGIGDGVQFYLS